MSARSRTSAPGVALTEAESRLANEIAAWLGEHHPDEAEAAAATLERLRALGDAAFAYPSVRDARFMRGEVFDEGRLVESLLEFSSSSRLLRIPTKIVAMRSFLVAKFHAFSMLCALSADASGGLRDRARGICFSVVSTLIAEAVYFSFLGDPVFSRENKATVALDLIDLWDSGVDLRGLRNFSALSSLWLARNSSPPNFGTMNGNAELLRLTMSLDEEWREFLVSEANSEQTRWALEEFLFGLSWEEIQRIRADLEARGIDAVGTEGVRGYVDSPSGFFGVDQEDPRTFYDFFVERRDACAFRKKLPAPGPAHTLEEIYLKHRIAMELA